MLVAEVGAGEAATTPGLASAAETSTRVIRACAIGLRRIAMCSRPGSAMLSVQLVRPVTSRASSLRRSGWPTTFCGLGRGLGGRSSGTSRRGCVLHGLDDVLVAGAAAEVAFEPVADLVLARVRVLLEQVDRRP